MCLIKYSCLCCPSNFLYILWYSISGPGVRTHLWGRLCGILGWAEPRGSLPAMASRRKKRMESQRHSQKNGSQVYQVRKAAMKNLGVNTEIGGLGDKKQKSESRTWCVCSPSCFLSGDLLGVTWVHGILRQSSGAVVSTMISLEKVFKPMSEAPLQS